MGQPSILLVDVRETMCENFKKCLVTYRKTLPSAWSACSTASDWRSSSSAIWSWPKSTRSVIFWILCGFFCWAIRLPFRQRPSDVPRQLTGDQSDGGVHEAGGRRLFAGLFAFCLLIGQASYRKSSPSPINSISNLCANFFYGISYPHYRGPVTHHRLRQIFFKDFAFGFLCLFSIQTVKFLPIFWHHLFRRWGYGGVSSEKKRFQRNVLNASVGLSFWQHNVGLKFWLMKI